jgi:hypothetical protein
MLFGTRADTGVTSIKINGRRGHSMAYEYPTSGGTLRLLRVGCQWSIEFNGCRRGHWTSADGAAMAAVRHTTGLVEWDRTRLDVSDDLLRWRPMGDNL